MYFVGRSSQFQLMLLFPVWSLALALVAWAAAGSGPGGWSTCDGVSLPSGPSSPAIPEFATILRQRGYRLVGEDPEWDLRLWCRAS